MIFVVVVVLILVYFLPSVIAWRRGRRNTGAIFCLNLFLGWSLIGWVVALVWAVSTDTPAVVAPLVQQQLSPPSPATAPSRELPQPVAAPSAPMPVWLRWATGAVLTGVVLVVIIVLLSTFAVRA